MMDEGPSYCLRHKLYYDTPECRVCHPRIDYEAKYREAMLALESLTPGGSEYVGDPKRCVEHVREAQASLMRGMHMWAKRAHAAEDLVSRTQFPDNTGR